MGAPVVEEQNATSTFTASTPEEAVEAGLTVLGLRPEEAVIEVVDRGSRGFLGFGKRPARVRVVWKVLAAGKAREVTEAILARMGVGGEVQSTQTGREVLVKIASGESDGLLIGRKGETLQALQHLVRRILGRHFPDPGPRFVLDVAGYRDRREEHLRQSAAQLAERVRRTGKRAMTEPLPPAERQAMHRALLQEAGVQGHTAGTGSTRRIVITPGRKKSSGG